MQTPATAITQKNAAGLLRLGAAALALALGMTACQKTLEPGDDATLDASLAANEEVALRLGVKATEECQSLRESLAAASEADQDSLHEDFADRCVEKVRDAEGHDLPPLDDALRVRDGHCRFVAVDVKPSGDEIVVTYRKLCREDGDDDGEHHDGLDDGDKEDDDGDKHDGLDEREGEKSECGDLHERIAKADLSEADLAALRERFAAVCTEPEHEPTCDGLRERLAQDGLSESDLAALRERFEKACTEPHEELDCEALRKRLADADLPEADKAALSERLEKACSAPEHEVPAEECASWLERLAQMNPESGDYRELRGKIAEHCLDVPPPVEERPDPPVVEIDCEDALLHLEAYEAEHPDSEEAVARRRHLAEMCADIQAP